MMLMLMVNDAVYASGMVVMVMVKLAGKEGARCQWAAVPQHGCVQSSRPKPDRLVYGALHSRGAAANRLRKHGTRVCRSGHFQ